MGRWLLLALGLIALGGCSYVDPTSTSTSDFERIDFFPQDIATDSLGDIYVAGWRNSGTGNDIWTAKYSRAGVKIWEKLYGDGRAKKIVVDSSGNSYVGGRIEGHPVVLKYNANGEFLWRIIFDAGEGELKGLALAIDKSLYALVQIRDEAVIVKYNGDGVLEDRIIYKRIWAEDMAIDSEGNIFMAASSFIIDDPCLRELYGFILKYNGSEWSLFAKYSEFLKRITIDGEGNLYSVGNVETCTNAPDYLTVKYAKTGEVIWKAVYDSHRFLNSYDYAEGSATDESGNVYVTGWSNNEMLTIKYGSSGDIIWERVYGESNNDVATSVAVSDDEIYVVGYSQKESYEVRIVKYKSDGQFIWEITE